MNLRLGAVLLFVAMICGAQGCASGSLSARTVSYDPQSEARLHRIDAAGVLAGHLESAAENSLEQPQLVADTQKIAAATSRACNMVQQEANQKAIVYFQNQLQIARLYKAEIMAVKTTTNMDAVFTPLAQQLIGESYSLPYYTCQPSFATLASVYNQYAETFNYVYTARVPILYGIADSAEGDLRTLANAKDRLIAALKAGPSPATTEARLHYRQAMSKLREYNLRDFYVDAKLGGGKSRTFKASEFWSRANAVMYQDIGDDYSGLTIEEILGSPTEANITITTSNSIATIEVRHMSYGPGFCTVETKSSLGSGNVVAAPPLAYGPWQTLEAHAGIITLTVSTQAKCDTGARSQVRYFK